MWCNTAGFWTPHYGRQQDHSHKNGAEPGCNNRCIYKHTNDYSCAEHILSDAEVCREVMLLSVLFQTGESTCSCQVGAAVYAETQTLKELQCPCRTVTAHKQRKVLPSKLTIQHFFSSFHLQSVRQRAPLPSSCSVSPMAQLMGIHFVWQTKPSHAWLRHTTPGAQALQCDRETL